MGKARQILNTQGNEIEAAVHNRRAQQSNDFNQNKNKNNGKKSEREKRSEQKMEMENGMYIEKLFGSTIGI